MKLPSIFFIATPFLLQLVSGESNHEESGSSPFLLRGSVIDNSITTDKHERKLVVNPEAAAADMAIALGWSVPVVGPLVSLALRYYFDGQNPSVWDQVKDQVAAMVTFSDVMDDTNLFESYMYTLRTQMENYDEASSDTVKGGYLEDLVSTAQDIHSIFQLNIDAFHLDCVNSPVTCDRNQLENNYYLMNYAVIFAPLHLAILQDQYMYGHYLFCSNGCPDTTDIDNYKTDLIEMAATYQTYFDFMRPNMWEYWRKDTFYFTLDCRLKHSNFPAPGSTYKTEWELFDRLSYFSSSRKANSCAYDSCSDSLSCARDQAKAARDGARKIILEANFVDLLAPMEDIGTWSLKKIPDVTELCEIGKVWCAYENKCKTIDNCVTPSCDSGYSWCVQTEKCIPAKDSCK